MGYGKDIVVDDDEVRELRQSRQETYRPKFFLHINTYMFSLTSMCSEQILGFIIYFWIDSYIDWIFILFEKEKRRYCYQA